MSFYSSSRDALVAKLLAAAVSIRCPKAKVVKASAESYGFCVEFYVPESISQELFPFFEETMYRFLKERDFRISEMTPYTAKEFLKFHHQKARARALDDHQKSLVQTIIIGSYTDFFEQDVDLKALDELVVFKLLSLTQNKEAGHSGELKTRFRIKGVSRASQSELKEFIKQIKVASMHSHTRLNQLMVIDDEKQEVAWLPQGLALKRKILDTVKRSLEQIGFEEIDADPSSFAKLRDLPQLESCKGYFCLSQQEVFENSEERDLGLYGLSKVTAVYAQSRLVDCQTCFQSVLQLMQELGVSCTLCLEHGSSRIDARWSFLPETCEKIPSKQKGDRLRFFVKDSFERNWEVACIEIDEKKNPFYVTISFNFLERLVALFLEMSNMASRR